MALQKYHNEHELTVPADDPDESVFDTITSLMGNNIARIARKFTVTSNTSSSHSSETDDNVNDVRKGTGTNNNGIINHSSSSPLLKDDDREKQDVGGGGGDEADKKTEDEQSMSDDDKLGGKCEDLIVINKI